MAAEGDSRDGRFRSVRASIRRRSGSRRLFRAVVAVKMTKRSKRVLDPDYLRIGGLIQGGTNLYAGAIKWIDPDPGQRRARWRAAGGGNTRKQRDMFFLQRITVWNCLPIGTAVLMEIRHVPLAISH